MSGNYGFSINLELTPTDTTNLHERVLDFLDGSSNEEEILRSVLLEEEENQIVFFGDNQDQWRYEYGNEVIALMRKIEDEFGGKFKGDMQWYSYELHSDTIQEWEFDGEGNAKYNIRVEELEDDYYPEDEEDDEEE